MSRIIFQTDEFQCPISCSRCERIKDDGQRCKNRVCFGVPYCWIHSKQMYGVKIKETQNNRGKGLFATRFIANDSWIAPYIGEHITLACLEQRYPEDMTAPYATSDVPEGYIDSACVRGISSMANGVFGRNGRTRSRNLHNAKIIEHTNDDGLWLRATRDIEEGDEILVYYGTQYRLENNHVTRRTRNNEDTRPC